MHSGFSWDLRSKELCGYDIDRIAYNCFKFLARCGISDIGASIVGDFAGRMETR